MLIFKEIFMKKTIAIALIFALTGLFATSIDAKTKPVAKSWTGVLIDKMCSKKMTGDMAKCSSHTKMCASEEMCAKSGYGVMVAGKYYKFDKKGDQLAAAYLKQTTKDKDMQIEVMGTMSGNTIKVTDLKDKM